MLFSQCRTTPMNIRWLKFHFQLTINAETTLSHQRWINVILSMLFQRCFVNVETTSINIRQLNFHSTKFQRWNNIDSSTLNRYNSINVVSTLFSQRWNNVDKCTSPELSFSTKYQCWNNVDNRWRSTLFQRWLNVDVFARKLQLLASEYQKTSPGRFPWKRCS